MEYDEIHKWLEEFGLNKSEITVYIAILEHPDSQVKELVAKTEILRTTLYNVLSQLKTKNLVTEATQNNVRSYRASDFSVFRHAIDARIQKDTKTIEGFEKVEQLLGSFAGTASAQDSYVERFEGVRGVKQSIEKAFRSKSKNWYIIAPVDNFLFNSPRSYQQYYLTERKRRGIKSKTLWDPIKEIENMSLEQSLFRAPRKLPEAFKGSFKSLFIIYDDTVLIIEGYDKKVAHAIHSVDSTQLMKLMFDTIWKGAEKY